MIYYLDASALVKVYSYENGTEAIIDLLKSNKNLLDFAEKESFDLVNPEKHDGR